MTLKKVLLIGLLSSVAALNGPVTRADATLSGGSGGSASSSAPYDGASTGRSCVQDWEEVPEGPECVLTTEADARTGVVRAGYRAAGRTDAAWAQSVVSESLDAAGGGGARRFTTVVDVEAGSLGWIFMLLADEDGRWLSVASQAVVADSVGAPIVLTAEEPGSDAGRTVRVHVGVAASYSSRAVDGAWIEQPYALCAPGYWMGEAPCVYGLPTLVPPTWVGSPMNVPGASPVALVDATVRSIAQEAQPSVGADDAVGGY